MAFTVNQVINQAVTNGSTVTFTSAVAAGDFLYIVLGSAGNFSSSGTITGVTDNINGSWTILDNSGVIDVSNLYTTGVFAYCANSLAAAANGLTITISGSGAGFGAIAVDLSGAATSSVIVGHAMNTALVPTGSSTPFTFTTPSVSDSNSGDFVIGWVASYLATTSYAAGSGVTLDDSYTANSSEVVGALHLTANSVNGSNSITGTTGAENNCVGGTVIVSQGSSVPNGAATAWLI